MSFLVGELTFSATIGRHVNSKTWVVETTKLRKGTTDFHITFLESMAAPDPPQPESYDPSILHEPVNVDPNGPIAKVQAMLRTTMRLSLNDGRVVEGVFAAFDKFGNFVLTDAEEKFLASTRALAMVIVPLNYIERVELGQAEPAAAEAQPAAKSDAVSPND
jgi:small nuclear ribonucleoprotein (snRNP)-like protein